MWADHRDLIKETFLGSSRMDKVILYILYIYGLCFMC